MHNNTNRQTVRRASLTSVTASAAVAAMTWPSGWEGESRTRARTQARAKKRETRGGVKKSSALNRRSPATKWTERALKRQLPPVGCLGADRQKQGLGRTK